MRYARSGDVSIASKLWARAPSTSSFVPFLINLIWAWEQPVFVGLLPAIVGLLAPHPARQARHRALRPAAGMPTFEARLDDIRAVMDAAGSERAALLGSSPGGPLCGSSPRPTRSGWPPSSSTTPGRAW